MSIDSREQSGDQRYSNSISQGTTDLEDYCSELGYSDPGHMHDDAKEFYDENGAFSADEFAEEYDLGFGERVEAILSLMRLSHKYDIKSQLVSDENEDDVELEFKIL